MTVAELIAKLKELPSDYRVLVSGYESDLTEMDVASPHVRLIHLNYDEGGYCGEHKQCQIEEYGPGAECWYCENSKDKPVKVVLIER